MLLNWLLLFKHSSIIFLSLLFYFFDHFLNIKCTGNRTSPSPKFKLWYLKTVYEWKVSEKSLECFSTYKIDGNILWNICPPMPHVKQPALTHKYYQKSTDLIKSQKLSEKFSVLREESSISEGWLGSNQVLSVFICFILFLCRVYISSPQQYSLCCSEASLLFHKKLSKNKVRDAFPSLSLFFTFYGQGVTLSLWGMAGKSACH